jgi:hypothetical protein
MSNSSSCTAFKASTLISYGSITAGSTALAAIRSFDSWLSSSSTGYYIRLYGYFYAICIIASLWVFYVARRLQPGLQRALVCLPVVVLQLAATPVLVDRHRTAVLIVPVCGIFSLAAFKVGEYIWWMQQAAPQSPALPHGRTCFAQQYSSCSACIKCTCS